MKKMKLAGDSKHAVTKINKGFIIASVLCFALVVTAVYFTVKSFNDTAENNRSQVISNSGSNGVVVNQQRPSVVQSSSPSSSSSSSSSSASASSEPESEAETIVTPPAQTVTFTAPLSGEVMASFSNDQLVFSETLKDWRVHNGVDFAAAVGTSVEAIADGTVEDVYYDELLGHTVSISHADGHVSIYCGLNEVIFVDEGEEVSQGYVIGTVGTEMPLESAQESHLHLEIVKDGVRVDPLSVIGQ